MKLLVMLVNGISRSVNTTNFLIIIIIIKVCCVD
jgi:hypothetical protein